MDAKGSKAVNSALRVSSASFAVKCCCPFYSSAGEAEALRGLPYPPVIVRHLSVYEAGMGKRIVDRIGDGRNAADIG